MCVEAEIYSFRVIVSCPSHTSHIIIVNTIICC